MSAGTDYIKDTMNCGPRRLQFSDGQFEGNPGCANYLVWCPLAAGAQIDTTKDIIVYDVYDSATNLFVRTDIACDVPNEVAPLPSMAAIRAETTRRAPLPTTETTGTRYLLNASIVFYDQPPRSLSDLNNVAIPTFDLGGHTFTVSLHLASTTWNWGDGSSDSYADTSDSGATGHPYRTSKPCTSNVECPGYIAHGYSTTGTFTATSQAHFTGTYRLDGGTDDIPIVGDIVTADAVGRTISVQQAGTVLTAPQ